jgi:hypothetical protein
MKGGAGLVKSGACLLVWFCVLFWCSVGVSWGLPSEHPFEVVPGSFHFETSSAEAGAHTDWVFSFDFAHELNGTTFNDLRTVVNNFPAGFDASNTAVPTCTDAQLLSTNVHTVEGELSNCPLASQIGDLSVEVFINPTSTEPPYQLTIPLYNMETTSFGTVASVGYRLSSLFTSVSSAVVRPEDDGITALSANIPKLGESHKVSVRLWGVPAAHEHDAMRGAICGGKGELPPVCRNEFDSPQEARIETKPFLSNPTSCGAFEATMQADSWEEPENWSSEKAGVGPIEECDRVHFEPSIEIRPTTTRAESPTGLDVSLLVPQTWDNPFTIATSNLKDTTVALPEGMTANPSLAAGLGACSPQQYAKETSSSSPGTGCPPESKIGSIEIETPLLDEKIEGAVYVATPYDNVPAFGDPAHPGGSLLALYVVAKDPARGLLIKVAGKVTPNAVTGQLVSTFQNTPQQPFSKFTLKFRPGPTAPLVSPPVCGNYATQAALTPWSAPSEPRTIASPAFAISEGAHGPPCPEGAVPPFHPQVFAGTSNNDGGAYSPFYLRLVREDGEQELTRFSTIMPPGLTGNLSGIPFCPAAAIAAARLATGVQELEHPSCPQTSEVGHTIVGAGVGTVLAQTPGKVYLAGPYNGAPLSLVSITSATVGPFDLGTVVIRFALRVNPITAQVEVDATGSDPIPHIIDGIVVHVRDIHVYIDREKFIINPTNCRSLSIEDIITGAGADYTNPADQVPVNVPTPFEAADCAGLSFKPVFKVSTTAKVSRANGASLSVKLTFPHTGIGSQANIAKVKVDLPKQLPSRLSTLQRACTDKQFEANPAGCPSESIVGHAKAITPILPVALEGPAYFVSHGGVKFPELIMVLQGYGITIQLHGETFISKSSITSSTFRNVPDQPVTSFELTLPQGKYSALAARGNLCKTKLNMPTSFIAQNGVQKRQTTKIQVTRCPKTTTKHNHKHKK